MDPVTLNQVRADLDRMGEQRVRRFLAEGAFDAVQSAAVQAWLDEIATLPTSRDALAAARAARLAAIAAIVSAVLAAMGLGLTLWSLFLRG